MRVEDGFQHTPYEEPNPYTSDPVLRSLLRRHFSSQESAFRNVDADLSRFGDRITNEIRPVASLATPPTLTQYDHWGKRVDHLNTSESWRKLKAIIQEEGIIGIFYEREYGELSRVYGFMKEVLSAGDAQVVYCPLSMTDGSARVLELLGTPEMKKEIFTRLISRDPEVAFTAGQWMTERPGGSDVSQTETVATVGPGVMSAVAPGAKYTLDGFKWFSSATDSHISLALARTGSLSQGSRGLSLFLVPLRLPLLTPPGALRPSSTSNGILVHRLKNKFGTQIVPTAELTLNNTEAYLLSPLNAGVKSITPVLNITRMHSAAGSVAYLRRGLAIAKAYASVRRIQGQTTFLKDVPLHTEELAKISLVYRGIVHLFFGAARLLGKTECGTATVDDQKRLRLLTPTVKAFTAEKGVAALEECMAALGGQGYMEETGLGRLIRDNLVERIWEGTIVVLSLDLVRAAADPTAISAYVQWAETIIASVSQALFANISGAIKLLRAAIREFTSAFAKPVAPLVPRPGIMLFGYITAALYLLEHAVWSHENNELEKEVDVDAFVRWVEESGLESAVKEVQKMKLAGEERMKKNVEFVYGGAKGIAKL